MERETTEKIRELIRQYFYCLRPKQEFVPGKTKIPLSVPSYSWEEATEAIEAILSTWVTMGEKVRRFETAFARYIGVNEAVMVNSGSSANLCALHILTNPRITKKRTLRGKEVITPAVTWATTVYPIANVEAVPVFVDVDLKTYNIDTDQIEEALSKKTRAIMPVHLLGNPCDMKRIMEIAKDNHLFVLEDACEAHGAEYEGKRVGSFGDLATFSFFMSHHITTIEGGMIVTNVPEYAELAKALRAFGWIRDLRDKDKIARRHKEIDPRFLFINLGFNVRPTEIQGAFGIHQIKKLEEFIKIRRENAQFFSERLDEYSDYLILPEEKKGTRHVWFGYPITVKPEAPFSREDFTAFLEKKMIETRPIMAGNITQQPVIKLIKHRKVGKLENSKMIMDRAFFFGNHHAIGREEREYIANCISEFIEERT